MDIVFTVHTVQVVGQNIVADVGGEKISAVINALEVELISDHHGTLTLRFVGSEKDDAEQKFVVDSKHTWTV